MSPAGVQRWISAADARYSSARVRKELTVLSQVLDSAVADERLSDNPVGRARAVARGPLIRPRTQKREQRFLAHLEVALLAKSAGDAGDTILVMSYAGVRFGEVTALRGHDVDLLRGRLNVKRAFSDVRGHLGEVMPKSGKVRQIPIPRLLHGVLERRPRQLSSPDDLLFQSSRGGPIRYSPVATRRLQSRDQANWNSWSDSPPIETHLRGSGRPSGSNPKVLQAAARDVPSVFPVTKTASGGE